MVSCIFTCTNDLDAEFPAVAARQLGLDQVPLLCAREIDVPGALPRVIRLLLHCYAEPESPAQARVPARGRALRRDLRGAHMTATRVQQRVRRIPVYPAAPDLRVRRRAGEARLERDALAAAPAGARGGGGRAERR